jgi:DNA-binding winged helix-turn-helix (wHTH) protein
VEREKLAHLNGEMLLECEDFLCKPILADELKTRIQAVLWRNGDGQLKYGAIVLDQRSKQVSIADAPIQLTPKEYQLLMLLIKAQGRVLCNQEIIERAWAGSGRATASDVQQYIHHLRRKMKTHIGADHCISNDKGFGYHLNCQECPDPCGDKSVDQGADAAGDGHTPTPRRRASDLGTTGSNSRRSWLVSC